MNRPLEDRNRRIDYVYFIEAGFASVVADGVGKPGIEVGIIGREGMTGLAIVLGQQRASHATGIGRPTNKLEGRWGFQEAP